MKNVPVRIRIGSLGSGGTLSGKWGCTQIGCPNRSRNDFFLGEAILKCYVNTSKIKLDSRGYTVGVCADCLPKMISSNTKRIIEVVISSDLPTIYINSLVRHMKCIFPCHSITYIKYPEKIRLDSTVSFS